jgi:hypothetical protein
MFAESAREGARRRRRRALGYGARSSRRDARVGGSRCTVGGVVKKSPRMFSDAELVLGSLLVWIVSLILCVVIIALRGL